MLQTWPRSHFSPPNCFLHQAANRLKTRTVFDANSHQLVSALARKSPYWIRLYAVFYWCLAVLRVPLEPIGNQDGKCSVFPPPFVRIGIDTEPQGGANNGKMYAGGKWSPSQYSAELCSRFIQMICEGFDLGGSRLPTLLDGIHHVARSGHVTRLGIFFQGACKHAHAAGTRTARR